ncbi:MAG TPA: DedA family protein [Thermoplasmata archaeon]|nr:DedA family protein [Thermoplasmata archaeon]
MTFTLVGSVTQLIVTVLETVGLPGLFALMVVESFGIPPIPSEVILPFAGFLVVDGTFSFAGALSVALAGALVGSFAAYAIGRWWRHRLLGLGIGRLRLEPRHLERVDVWFARHGEVTVGLARLVPVIRSYVSYPAGTAQMSPLRFGVYTLLGSIPFTVAFLYAGMVLRSNWTVVESYFSVLDDLLIALIVIVVVYIALQIVGVLAPGWPPRRARPAGTAPGPGPGHG